MSAPLFRIIIRAHNAEQYITRCIRSLHKQSYTGWHADVWLDAPFDRTRELLDTVIDELCPYMVHVHEQPKRRGLGRNLCSALSLCKRMAVTSNQVVIAILDGDDYLKWNALERVAKEYEDPRCLITHGSYEKHSKKATTKISQPYPKGADVMTHPWRASHLKTFRASLLEYIDDEWWKDERGHWLPAASDVALMLPLIQRVGLQHVRFIPDPIYVWRDDTGHKTNRTVQKECEEVIRRRWAHS